MAAIRMPEDRVGGPVTIWERIESDDCFVVAEVGQAHDGSLGMAHAFVDLAADCGADAVKFQTHIASAESTLDEPWRVRVFPQDSTRFDYWRRTGFSAEQWRSLAKHARDRNIEFLSSPFSVEAVRLLDDIGQPFFKIASGEVYNPELLEAAIATGRPLVVSTGMSTLADIDAVVDRCRSALVPFAVLQCTSAYPAPPAEWGLDAIAEMRKRYGCPIGFSDHSGAIAAGLAAVTLGARLVEVHLTMSRSAFGPDVPASLDGDALAQLVSGVEAIVAARNSSAPKDLLSEKTRHLRSVFGRSLAPTRPLSAGHVLERSDLALKKPGTGIPYDELEVTLGRALACDVVPERLLRREDLV